MFSYCVIKLKAVTLYQVVISGKKESALFGCTYDIE